MRKKPPGRHKFPEFKTQQWSNDYIATLCKKSHFQEAISAFNHLQSTTSFLLLPSTYAHLLSAASSLRSLPFVRRLHRHLLSSPISQNLVLFNHLLTAYGKCSSPADARLVFDQMPLRNSASFSAMVATYSNHHHHHHDALSVFMLMLRSSFRPDLFSLAYAIRSSPTPAAAGNLHALTFKSFDGSHLLPQNALLHTYANLGLVAEMALLFSSLRSKDLLSWTSAVSGFVRMGFENEAFVCFREMLRSPNGARPNEFLFGSVLNACGEVGGLRLAVQAHGLCLRLGHGLDPFSGCALADMYGKCGLLAAASRAFDEIDEPDVPAWNMIISAFCGFGRAEAGFTVFSKMRWAGCDPDHLTIGALLSWFEEPRELPWLESVHGLAVKLGVGVQPSVGNRLVAVYSKCSESFSKCLVLFEEIRGFSDTVSWNSIMAACLRHKKPAAAFIFYGEMRGFYPHVGCDHLTFSCLAAASGELVSLGAGCQVHCQIKKVGLFHDVAVVNAMIDMYTKCGCLPAAEGVFRRGGGVRDVVSWTSLIVGHAQCGFYTEALSLFCGMVESGVRPNQVTMVGVLTACSRGGRVEEGRRFFDRMEAEHGVVRSLEHCSCVVDMFARSGRLLEAERFIEEMVEEPDVVIWKSLLAGCRTHGDADRGKRAAERILWIEPSNSTALVALSGIYAAAEEWDGVAEIRRCMKRGRVRKVPGASWTEVAGGTHVFLAEDNVHPEMRKVYDVLMGLKLHMRVAGCSVDKCDDMSEDETLNPKP